MATSGSIDFTVTTEQIITRALSLLGILGEGEAPNTEQINSNSTTLNLMAKNWQAQGFNLYAVQRVYVFLSKDKREYKLGSTGDQSTVNFFETRTQGTASGNTITVDDASGINIGDFIGVQVENLDMDYTTVANVSGNTVTLNATLSSTSPDNGWVVSYTKKANRPMKILESVVKLSNSGTETPIDSIARADYVDLSQKETTGRVNQLYYDPQIDLGTLFVWPITDDATNYLVLRVQRTLDDFDAVGDTPDYPQEWYLPLVYGLAYVTMPEYAVDRDRANRITSGYGTFINDALGFDADEYMHIRPDDRWETRNG